MPRVGPDERGDGGPVLSPSIVSGKECVVPIKGNRTDGPLYAVVVDLEAAVGQGELLTIPGFSDIGQCLAERRFGRDTGAVMDEPGMHVGNE